MSRRARALAFGSAALASAVLAATLAGGYRSGVEDLVGPLRPVVVARTDLAAGRVVTVAIARRRLEVRQVPGRFVPPSALAAVAGAVGRGARRAHSGRWLSA